MLSTVYTTVLIYGKIIVIFYLSVTIDDERSLHDIQSTIPTDNRREDGINGNYFDSESVERELFIYLFFFLLQTTSLYTSRYIRFGRDSTVWMKTLRDRVIETAVATGVHDDDDDDSVKRSN